MAAVESASDAVSIIMVVLNEEKYLRTAVTQALAQDYAGPLEVVIALGPSKDRTDEIAAELAAEDSRVKWVRNPSPIGATPSGLNAAIAASTADIVVRIDGHANLSSDYVSTAVQTLHRTGADNVGGVMAAEGITSWEQAVAVAMTSKIGVGNASFHTGGGEGPADTVYLGVFRREALQRVGGYDEHFLRAQDWEMNLRIRRSGGVVWFNPQLRVQYRPRSSVKALAKQYFHYGRWRRIVMRTHEGTVNLRYLAPPVALTGIVLGILLGLFVHPVGWLAPLGYAALVTAGGLWEGRRSPWPVRLQVPVSLATMHLSWGWGFLTSPKRMAKQVADGPTSSRV